MPLIEDTGGGLGDSAFSLRLAARAVQAGRTHIADAQGILMGVAKESADPQLAEAIEQYVKSMDALTAAMGSIATAGEKISVIASRVGCEVFALSIPERPAIYVTDIPEPAPREGDPGSATPEQFNLYKELEKRIDTSLGDDDDPEDIQGYLTDSVFCHLFRTPDGKIIKVPMDRRTIYTDEHNSSMAAGVMWHVYARGLRQARGQEGLEQFVAYIDDEGGWRRGAVVCEPMPGDILSKLTNDQVLAIPDGHLAQLMQVFQVMEALGLFNDIGPENVTYHPDKGFTFGNYWLFEEWRRFASDSGDIHSNEAKVMAADFIFFSHHYDERIKERYVAAYEQTFGKAAAEELRNRILRGLE